MPASPVYPQSTVLPLLLSPVVPNDNSALTAQSHQSDGQYSLTHEQYIELLEAAETSKLQIKIHMKDMKSDDRKLVLSFARKFEGLDNNEKEKIMKILQGEDQ